MPERIRLPGCPVFYVLVGNETAEHAGHIVNGINDHVSAPINETFACVSLVDENFSDDGVLFDGVYFRYHKTDSHGIRDSAVRAVQERFQTVMDHLDANPNTGVQLTKVALVLVIDAASAPEMKDIEELRSGLCEYFEHDGRLTRSILCILADNNRHGEQYTWLKSDSGNWLNKYEKIMILSPQDINGFSTPRTRNSMQDSILPATLQLLGDTPTEHGVYTASFQKLSGNSNDITELKRHIAADVLDLYFVNAAQLADRDQWMWELLSTDSIRMNKGQNLQDRLTKASDALVPTMESILLTADLSGRDADFIGYLTQYDELNRRSGFRKMEISGKQWADEVKERIVERQCLYPDVLLKMLDENGPIYRELIRSWSDCNDKAKQYDSKKGMEEQLGSVTVDDKKKLFDSTEKYNLRYLSQLARGYADICSSRVKLAILDCIREGIDDIRCFLREMIGFRKNMLKPYRLTDAKLRVLTDICPKAENSLRSDYGDVDITKFPVFMTEKEFLYSADQDRAKKAWERLMKAFIAEGKNIGSFAKAFVMNLDNTQLEMKVEEALTGGNAALIPSFPDKEEGHSLPTPSVGLLLNKTVAEPLPRAVNGAAVYEVPGDLLESIGLYHLDETPRILSLLSLFQEDKNYRPEWRFEPITALNPIAPRRAVPDASEAEGNVNANPWDIRLIERNREAYICWNHFDRDYLATVSIDGSPLITDYDRHSWAINSHGCRLSLDQLPDGAFEAEIAFGPVKKKALLYRQQKPVELSLQEKPKKKVKVKSALGDAVYCAYQILQPDEIDSTGKCLLCELDGQSYLVPFADTVWVGEGSAVHVSLVSSPLRQ